MKDHITRKTYKGLILLIVLLAMFLGTIYIYLDRLPTPFLTLHSYIELLDHWQGSEVPLIPKPDSILDDFMYTMQITNRSRARYVSIGYTCGYSLINRRASSVLLIMHIECKSLAEDEIDMFRTPYVNREIQGIQVLTWFDRIHGESLDTFVTYCGEGTYRQITQYFIKGSYSYVITGVFSDSQQQILVDMSSQDVIGAMAEMDRYISNLQ